MAATILLLMSIAIVATFNVSPCRGNNNNNNSSSNNSSSSSNNNNESENATDNRQWANCPSCGLNQRNRIVGGRSASIKDFPWTVDIRYNGRQHCGGSIVRSSYVLTAAHCVAGLDATKLVVVASVTDILDTKAFKSKVISSAHHPLFERTTYDYDVAVLTLARKLSVGRGVRAVCLHLAGADDPVGEKAVVSGWGAMSENSVLAPNQLRRLGVPVVSNDDCEKAKGLEGQAITERMLCAGYLNGTKDACSGDSGGPLVWYHKGAWIQIGIVSWGIGCARANYYGIYSRVSTLTSWIAENTEGVAGC